MKNVILFATAALVLVLNVGCSHFHKVQGTESRSEIPEGVRVAIGSPEVKEGDKVSIYKTKCVKKKKRMRSDFGESGEQCSAERLGTTQVIKVLTSEVAIVRPPDGFTMDSDMYVEKGEN